MSLAAQDELRAQLAAVAEILQLMSSSPSNVTCPCSKLQKTQQVLRFGRRSHTVIGMLPLLPALGSLLPFRVRSRASLELELVALHHRYERRAA